jgi:zinc protease
LHYDGEYLEEIKAVTAEDIRTAARKYLIPERMTGVILQPKGEESYKWPKSFLGADVKTPKPAKLKKPVGDQAPRIFETAHGLKVVHFEKPGSHVAAVHLSAMGGSRLETKFGPEAEGASNILAQTWTKGTTRLNSKQLANFVENRAASIDGFSGKNTIGLQMTSLVRDWKDMSPLFLEVLTQPTFTEEELALSRKVTEESIRSIPDHSSQVCTLQFLESVMPNHPYGKSSLGSIENLIHHNTDQMKKIHKEWIQPKNMTLSVVGGVNETQLNIWLEEFEKHLQYSQKHFGDEDPLPEAPLKAPRWAHTHFGREQTHIIVGGLGLSMFDPRRSALANFAFYFRRTKRKTFH